MAQKNNTLAAVAYIFTWLSGLIVFLTVDKKDKYTRFHAFQSILFGIAITVIAIVLAIVSAVVSMFSLRSSIVNTLSGSYQLPVGPMILSVISGIFWVFTLVVIIICAVKAYQGSEFQLPIIGKIAKKHVA